MQWTAKACNINLAFLSNQEENSGPTETARAVPYPRSAPPRQVLTPRLDFTPNRLAERGALPTRLEN